MPASMPWSWSIVSDHGELGAHQRYWPFRILNILDVVGVSTERHCRDRFKELRMTQDVDLILSDGVDMIAGHGLEPDSARSVVLRTMLGDQPLPLKGRSGLDHP
jgi:heterodisulfide reductase subunit D